ncbi:GntR family transcriptional regulator [Caproiciproducens galactitolivorans]|uniref:HTH-type transcriptional repressor YtrA n=1 Tax=Caproiciproducens galactitolivorans TaxID=642589 RepID=A0A4Z0Y1X6_9FIRM|nr:GntR family transcriptional regulator [Caproiciproducens galactitolivorans]QEY34297.1 GntR family transcriptional regulator [Caproiciproducens galactitolivorans]TGJ77939.1 HTH-type transcriptional repressor YtrA [Caproiciproducens galactitolivorans]
MAWNLKSDRPIYSQLVEQIELLIVSGIYPAGSKLPSVRDLAGEASVNPNTMQRALAQLENDGLLYTQRTSGRFVTEDVERIMQIKNNLAQGLIKEFIENMRNLGYDTKQAIQLLEKTAEEEE